MTRLSAPKGLAAQGVRWDPALYGRYASLRLRPARDLLARVPDDLPGGKIVDLGCGNGAAGPAIADRFPDRKIIGVDAAPAMLAEAAATGAYHRCDLADAVDWRPGKPPALIFANGLLQWLPDHDRLIPDLAGRLARGGVLALQMSRQHNAPSHRFLREFAAEMFPDRFDFTGWQPPVAAPIDYLRMLAPLGAADVWETDYLQRLPAAEAGHPVRLFTEPTTMRPFLDLLAQDEAAAFLHRYEMALGAAYPIEADGSVIFPYRRMFLTLRVG